MRPVVHWYLQRITGARLVFLPDRAFLGGAFASEQLLRGDLNYAAIRARISQPVWQGIDIAFPFRCPVSRSQWVAEHRARLQRRATRGITIVPVLVGANFGLVGITAFRNL